MIEKSAQEIQVYLQTQIVNVDVQNPIIQELNTYIKNDKVIEKDVPTSEHTFKDVIKRKACQSGSPCYFDEYYSSDQVIYMSYFLIKASNKVGYRFAGFTWFL
jgi:signal recognition particle GTPase